MIRITICDDNTEELEKLSDYVQEYMEAKNLDFQIYKFAHPNELLNVCKKVVFQIYILDIVMPHVDGIELGSEIRRHDKEAQIIYATTEPQYALSAYRANPLNYLLKPIQPQQLFDTLTTAIGKINMEEESVFPVKTSGGVQIVKYGDIICCEYTNHCVWFTLISGDRVKSNTITGKFIEYIAEVLEHSQFLQPHTSFAINMRYVERFDKDAFTLRGNIRIPISARVYQEVRERYMDYLMGEGSV